MSCVAEFTIPPSEFPFGRTLVEMPDVEITVDQVVPTDESALPFFWVTGCEPDEFVAAAEQEPSVADARLLEQVGRKALFRAAWQPNAEVIDGFRELDAMIVEAVGTAEHWRFEIRSAEHATFASFRELFERQGIPIELTRLYSLDEVMDGEEGQLTETQRETLVTAHRHGYFEKPREVTQSELADEFSVSRRSVSERLRRAMSNLIGETIQPTGGEEET